MNPYVGIKGPGIAYITDIKKWLQQPGAQRQIEALRKLKLIKGGLVERYTR